MRWEVIRSTGNEQLKALASLQRRKRRDESGLFLVEGLRAVEEAILSGWRLQALVVAEGFQHVRQVEAWLDRQQRHCDRCLQVPEALLRKLGETQAPQGVLAVVQRRAYSLEEVLASGGGPILVLDRLQDPGNVGTLLRTAAALGAGGAILLQGTADAFGAKAVRAGMGALFRLPLIQDVCPEEVEAARKKLGLPLWVAALEAGVPSLDAPLSQRHLLLLGNEGDGAAAFWLDRADGKVFIPMPGRMESLNVAMAGSLLLYEAMRQRLQAAR